MVAASWVLSSFDQPGSSGFAISCCSYRTGFDRGFRGELGRGMRMRDIAVEKADLRVVESGERVVLGLRDSQC